jgi:uncharacterized protein YgiM (DUF1202 family)
MLRLLAMLLALQAFHVPMAQAKDPALELVVSEPFLEMHSGPGRGFPVVYVVGRDETLTVLFSRTDWYKVRAPGGQEGWARRSDMALTKMLNGDPAPIPPYPDFPTHHWEWGAAYGVYNHQNLVSTWVDYALTESLDGELVLQQAFGTIDNRYIATIGLRHTFLPEKKWFSPTASIGTGYQNTQEKVPPAPLEKNNQVLYGSVGARGFITRTFMWRFDWRRYVVLNRLNTEEELEEWKVGLAVFF